MGGLQHGADPVPRYCAAAVIGTEDDGLEGLLPQPLRDQAGIAVYRAIAVPGPRDVEVGVGVEHPSPASHPLRPGA